MSDPFAPIHELAPEIAAGRLSPVEVTETCLDRIASLDPKLHAFAAVYADEAREASEAAHRAIRAGTPHRPAARHPDRREGPLRHGGPRDHWRRGYLEGTHLAHHRHPGRAPARRRHDRHRQDAYGRIRLWRLGHQQLRSAPPGTPGTATPTAYPAGRRAAPARASAPGSSPAASAPTPAARCGCRPPSAVRPASRPRSGGSALMACSRFPTRSTRRGRLPAPSRTAPGFWRPCRARTRATRRPAGWRRWTRPPACAGA